MKYASVPLTAKKDMGGGCVVMGFTVPREMADVKPAQFFMLKLPEVLTPFLARPFSVFRVDKNINERGEAIVYFYMKVKGSSTKLLAQLGVGERLNLWGPLGNSFEILPGTTDVIMVAGGIGVAPFGYLIQTILEMDDFKPASFELLVGAKTRSEIMSLEDFKNERVTITVSTDDGSQGEKGLVTDVLERKLRNETRDPAHTVIYVCGPDVMIRKVCGIGGTYGASVKVSYETVMACGIGICQGCVIEVIENGVKTYKKVCKDGPVFDGCEIIV